MKRWIHALLVCGLLTSALPTTALASSFSDTQGHWAEAYIDYVAEQGLFYGSGDLFLPEDTMTRGMFVTVLARLAEREGLSTASQEEISFVDVPADAYYADYVAWGSENQIISGISTTQFAPDQPVTREQMCALLVRFLNWMDKDLSAYTATSTTFTDGADISDYALSDVSTAQNIGLIRGVEQAAGMAFQPQESASRAAVATVFVLLTEYVETGKITGAYVGEAIYTQEEIAEEALIAEYLDALLTNYASSTYLLTTDQVVQDCMKTLMTCMELALEARESGTFLTREFVQTTYGSYVEEVGELYDALTDTEYNQLCNVIVRLGTTDQIYAVMDFFDVSRTF